MKGAERERAGTTAAAKILIDFQLVPRAISRVIQIAGGRGETGLAAAFRRNKRGAKVAAAVQGVREEKAPRKIIESSLSPA